MGGAKRRSRPPDGTKAPAFVVPPMFNGLWKQAVLKPSVAGREPRPSPDPLLGPSSPAPCRERFQPKAFFSVRRCCGVLVLRPCGESVKILSHIGGKVNRSPKILPPYREKGAGTPGICPQCPARRWKKIHTVKDGHLLSDKTDKFVMDANVPLLLPLNNGTLSDFDFLNQGRNKFTG